MFDIIPLPIEKWKGFTIPIGYTTYSYYEVISTHDDGKFSVTLQLRTLEKPITHTPEEYDFPDSLYQDYYPGAQAFGIFDGDSLIAAMELCLEKWSNRMRLTELWVDEKYRRRGFGHALMEKAKSITCEKKCRALMLETQCCNVNAIGFYLHEGFSLIGFDICCFSNHDPERKEVRMEMGVFFNEYDTVYE